MGTRRLVTPLTWVSPQPQHHTHGRAHVRNKSRLHYHQHEQHQAGAAQRVRGAPEGTAMGRHGRGGTSVGRGPATADNDLIECRPLRPPGTSRYNLHWLEPTGSDLFTRFSLQCAQVARNNGHVRTPAGAPVHRATPLPPPAHAMALARPEAGAIPQWLSVTRKRPRYRARPVHRLAGRARPTCRSAHPIPCCSVTVLP